MSEQLILEKLSRLENQYIKTENKIDKIDATISIIAVQTERINSVSTQVQELWIKYDEAFKPNWIVNKIQNHQAGCPKKHLEKELNQLWGALAIMVTAGIALCGWVLTISGGVK